jgi:hypothetical protein
MWNMLQEPWASGTIFLVAERVTGGRRRPDFFYFYRGRRSEWGARQARFFLWLCSSLSRLVLLTTNPMSPWQVLLLKDFWLS